MTTTTTKTTTKTKAQNVHKQLPEIIAKARKEFGENRYLITYDHNADEWKAQKKVVKGDGGMTAYVERHGCDEDSVLFGGV
ncbi:hypothetical protein [Bacillus cereus group sp. TH152-1LC]|uniref:hypothetical protein n=1 Tax=Bacillus cereus group sp. TH152-1LC TaxID=3018060 RepID=UPI0022DFFF42|nr:hypothetical protein [Bacillus cereus group sp. TH152-1LC]MDA1677025.1 hypothetical protein [Bacillus cereus group sp. TH152-1LC]